jgi:hypothetical protein
MKNCGMGSRIGMVKYVGKPRRWRDPLPWCSMDPHVRGHLGLCAALTPAGCHGPQLLKPHVVRKCGKLGMYVNRNVILCSFSAKPENKNVQFFTAVRLRNEPRLEEPCLLVE